MTGPCQGEPWLVLGLDPGSVRIGAARSVGPSSAMAVALPPIRNDDDAISHVRALVSEFDPRMVVVGLPLRLDGTIGPAAESALAFALALGERIAVPVRMLDERLTTVQAQERFWAAGKDVRASRPLIDSASAIILVEAVLAGASTRDPADFH